MRRVNTKRHEQMRRRCFDGPDGQHAESVRLMRCVCWSATAIGDRRCWGPVQAAHVVARGWGSVNATWADIVPLCAGHHREAGESRTSQRAVFEQRYGVDLRRCADDLAATRLGDVARRDGDFTPADFEALTVWVNRARERMTEAQMAAALGIDLETLRCHS